MPDPKHDESFRVIDRRLFNPDGEIRDEQARAERRQRETEPPTETKSKPAAEGSGSPAAPGSPTLAPPTEAQAPKAEQPQASRGLEMLINFVAQNAAMLLGAYPDPRSGQPIVDLEGARELIDMLDALRDTTRGNLAPDDDRLLLDVLGSLKLSFMEMTKAAAKAREEKIKAQR